MLADPHPPTVIRPSPYSRLVGGHFPESGLATFLRAVGRAVRVAVSARRARSGRTDRLEMPAWDGAERVSRPSYYTRRRA